MSPHPSHRNKHGATLRGTVIAAFGRHYEILTANGVLQCYPRGKKSVFACGDEVDILPSGDGQGAIEHLHPRHNLLWRSDTFRKKLIAANLSHVVIVVATEPGFSSLLISRCIAAAESQNLIPLIVLNKVDLNERLTEARRQLAPFTALGYETIETSAQAHIAPLKARLDEHRSILVGQSGMGKSTLTNALIPEAKAATREISAALDTGKHTTTFARLYPLGAQGWLIDSPGLQAFGLAHLDTDELAQCFIEFRPHLGRCRFRDCRHDAEPGCALHEALATGAILPQRLEHYRTIRQEITEARRLNPGW